MTIGAPGLRAPTKQLNGSSAPTEAETLLVTLSVADLRALVSEALADALDAATLEPAPALIDSAELARQLACCTKTVLNLRREGLPAVFLGDSPRFELGACLQWLRARANGFAPTNAANRGSRI